jgi:hypothetical protein
VQVIKLLNYHGSGFCGMHGDRFIPHRCNPSGDVTTHTRAFAIEQSYDSTGLNEQLHIFHSFWKEKLIQEQR